MDNSLSIFGIRHHGPGSSRSLLRALEQAEPDIVLIEGPPDADAILPLAGFPTMVPPVALLVYLPDQPNKAVFFPFAAFSPEWTAIQYAGRRGIPARFIDLPQSYQLAMSGDPVQESDNELTQRPADPFGFLAEAAGYSDSERWWENLVEHRRTDTDVFDAILEGIGALREDLDQEVGSTDAFREAYMRQSIRKAKKEGYCKISAVCGAWHAPALNDLSSIRADSALLSGLTKVKVAATWVPWTHNRLSYKSGYGAGIESPGWYAHLWESDSDVTARWMTKVSRLFQEHDLATSPSHVIEGVRLAEALAALRGHSIPGLTEMNEAVQTVFSFGSSLQFRLIEQKLIIGSDLGSVPPETPMVPLQLDIERKQRQLRLPPEALAKTIDLDLRKENDLDKSHLLHRLGLLGMPWGKPVSVRGSKGTFHEFWELVWRPEFAIDIIEAAVWGNTVADASLSSLLQQAKESSDLPQITNLLNRAILADLPDAVHSLMSKLQQESAITADTGLLMDSLKPLVGIARYGNVRNIDKELVEHIIDGLIIRITVGLPHSCISLDDQAADQMFERVKQVHSAINLLQNTSYIDSWLACLSSMLMSSVVHPKILGRSCRILLDTESINTSQAESHLRLALSGATEPEQGASWIEGFLQDSAQLLILDHALRTTVDQWICAMPDDKFENMLPLMRRTFSTFTNPERKEIGNRISSGSSNDAHGLSSDNASFDYATANAVLPLLLKLLGRSSHVGVSN